jgi:hypothetical protein
MTNREKLNSMSDKDLAGFFCEAMEKIAEKVDSDHDDMCTICPVRKMCRKGSNGFLNWLQADAEEPKEKPWYQSDKIRLIDRIRYMSATELADFLTAVEPINHRVDRYVCDKCKKKHNGKCPCNDGDCVYGSYTESDMAREWLLQEVEE